MSVISVYMHHYYTMGVKYGPQTCTQFETELHIGCCVVSCMGFLQLFCMHVNGLNLMAHRSVNAVSHPEYIPAMSSVFSASMAILTRKKKLSSRKQNICDPPLVAVGSTICTQPQLTQQHQLN